MFFSETGYEGLSAFPDEEEILALQEDCHERMEVTIKRLCDIIAQTPLFEAERQLLLHQLSHIQQHLTESLNILLANKRLRNN